MSLLRNFSTSFVRWSVFTGPASRLGRRTLFCRLWGALTTEASVKSRNNFESITNTFSTVANPRPATSLKNLNLSSTVRSLLPTLLTPGSVQPSPAQQSRSVTKWSLKKGKRKSVKAVTDRFYRLDWGTWIRPIVGRNKKKWKKTPKRKIRALRHVLCNATQSTLLDKMVTKFWRKRRFYVEDIYEPYHQREEFARTARKPQ